jgi:hypothetical protein
VRVRSLFKSYREEKTQLQASQIHFFIANLLLMRNGLNIPRPHHPSRFYIPTRSLSSVVIFDNKMKLAKLGYFEGIEVPLLG